ncbi:MAG: toll/interleukin-1 receptor domain-containing protein, partial [Planctomycetaceae bacterium]|nr:toll/interleukin-1 receptor domain-containing protein [Planctomycetaceae bacterium]
MSQDEADSPITIYIVHHPKCQEAENLAGRLYQWFRLGYLSGDSSAAGLPVHFRRRVSECQGAKGPKATVLPQIEFSEAAQNVVIAIIDHQMVLDPRWREAIVGLAEEIRSLSAPAKGAAQSGSAILLPVAIHDSFYRLAPVYETFNPIRLLGMTDEQMESTIRRAVTESAARMLVTNDRLHPQPLNVFLSHAKADGIVTAETLRDGIRRVSQLTAWYDANDLPYGASWNSPMQTAAREGTAALIAVMSDAYPGRPWCRKEATLARTPRCLADRKIGNRIWTLQPVVAVRQTGTQWTRGMPMLEGVPAISWNPVHSAELTAKVVDRLVLDVLLRQVHLQLAQRLLSHLPEPSRRQSCFITWIPDAWTLMALRTELSRTKIKPASIRNICYPGYGLTDT